MGEPGLQSQLWDWPGGSTKDLELITKDQLRSSSQSVISNKVTTDRLKSPTRNTAGPSPTVQYTWALPLCPVRCWEALPRWLLRFPSTIKVGFSPTAPVAPPGAQISLPLLLSLFSLLRWTDVRHPSQAAAPPASSHHGFSHNALHSGVHMASLHSQV